MSIKKVTLLIMEHICPITTEPIEEMGMTCAGSVYEFDAITEWLEDHNTDPLTGECLPTTRVKVIEKRLWNMLDELKRQTRSNTKKWYRSVSFEKNSLKKLARIEDIYKKMDEMSDSWVRYRKVKRLQFEAGKVPYLSPFGDVDIDEYDLVVRPKGTGKEFQFIDLSNLEAESKIYKCAHFDMADLSNSTFIDCDFSRATFMGANLEGIQFISCRFIGEEVNFMEAKVDHRTKFIGCRVEQLDRWITDAEPEKVRENLESRGLKGDYIVE